MRSSTVTSAMPVSFPCWALGWGDGSPRQSTGRLAGYDTPRRTMLELWRAGGPNSSASAAVARAVEAEGWDGQMFMDSQSLSADPWVQMGAWAIATERLKLATGVTNPFTRHLAVTAACAASVQAISGGRAVLGLGR